MRLSKLYMPTLREDPQDAEIVSHKFLLRGGFIRKSASGIYTYLTLGYRVVRKIENIVREIEVGKIYEGTVTKIAQFGAFIDLGGGKEGLLHISKISSKRIQNVEDVLAVGDVVKVKVTDIDGQGKISLNMRDLETLNS